MSFIPQESVQALQTLGFSALEASIYSFLLTESTATGYRIAQALGKPVANTYKGIQALQAKGAVLVEDGSTRLCRAVPPDELMGQMERAFLFLKTPESIHFRQWSWCWKEPDR